MPKENRMPNALHDTTPLAILPANAKSSQGWEQEVLPRLPQGWEQQAKHLKALTRARQIRHAGDLLRGLLAYVLCVRSFRQLGCWGVLIDLADLSEAAWRKRMSQAEAWLEWLVRQMLALSACTSPWLVRRGLRRILLVDGTHLACQGEDGKRWRIHTSFDLLAGRLAEVQVTTDAVAETWSLFGVQQGDLLISDRINGYQQRLFFIQERDAQAIVRFTPATLPLFEDAEHGRRLEIVSWLKGRRAPAGRVCSRSAWLRQGEHQMEVRVVALRLTEAQTQAARRRKSKKAKKDKRQIQSDTLYLAGWMLLVTTLTASEWHAEEVLTLYRSRWHIELLFKRMKQLLETHRLRCVQTARVRASLLVLLLSWLLQEEELVAARLLLQEACALPSEITPSTLMPEPEQGQTGAISEWMLASLHLDVLREQIRGSISAARLRACLPRLHRFLRGSPRQRTHWFTQVRHWLTNSPF
jgi:DDE family transposase